MGNAKNQLIAWDGETYKGAGDYFERIREQFEDLDIDEALRLAIYAWNCHADANGMDLEALKDEEQECFAGEFMNNEEFTKDLLIETCTLPADLPGWVVIDWAGTWDTALRFDYFSYDVIDMDGNYRQFFWRNY